MKHRETVLRYWNTHKDAWRPWGDPFTTPEEAEAAIPDAKRSLLAAHDPLRVQIVETITHREIEYTRRRADGSLGE